MHALALWVWHAPALFNAVLIHPGLHDLQHFTFFATALLFWTALFKERRQDLGGLIMWVPASLVYIGAALVLLSRWITISDRARVWRTDIR